MTEKEYLQELQELIEKIKLKKLDNAEEKLNTLYDYKPVRLLWYVAKAELLFAKKKPLEGWKIATPRAWLGISYPGMKELQDFHRRIFNYWNNQEGLEQINYLYGDSYIHDEKDKELNSIYDIYIHKGTDEALYDLMRHYSIVNQKLIYYIIQLRLIKSGYLKENVKYFTGKNYDYIKEKLLLSKNTFIIVSEDDNQKECDLLTELLNYFDQKVYILSPPIELEDAQIHTEEVVKICMDNLQQYSDATVVPTCTVRLSNENMEDNRAEVVRYLCENVIDRKYAVLLATGTRFSEFLKSPYICKNVECLSEFDDFNFPDKMHFGWAGNYLEYISDIYNYDVKPDLDKVPEYDFSIVIPARNVSRTLYYTLQTCLNQDYEGKYEVLVSDNSTEGRMEVCKICKELNDERIRYVQTPRNLALTKSFEFAFLQAKGEFIFAIGSDDAVCPWALSMLKKVMDKHPEEEVLQWLRGFYGWEGFNGRQDHQLIIPGKFKKDEIKCRYENNTDLFVKVLKDKSWMFLLPNLYINSGFKHSYLRTLYQKTGRLWDGNNQDIYMGIINNAINKQILNIDFPLTIAGMSSNSMGYVISEPSGLNNDSAMEEIRRSATLGDNIGIHIECGITREMPLGRGNSYSLYVNLLRAIQLGVLPDSWRTELLDYKKIYTDFFKEHTRLDEDFDKWLHYARYQALLKGEEFLMWFDDTIYKQAVYPLLWKKKKNDTVPVKTYIEGPENSDGLILDASVYGVTSIVEALEVFKRFLYWTEESWKEELDRRKRDS